MGKTIFAALFILFSIYAIIPTVVVRLFGFGAFKRGGGKRGAALTFDDGPDPVYTPRLLDILDKYGIKATFFVLGSKAERHPEIILRIYQAGHLIGIHNYVHRANGLMTPWRVRKQLRHSADVIERITGERPAYYRPPWGIINLFDFLLLKQFRMILWSLIVGDWNRKGGKQKIKQRLLAQLKDGSVIVLHDSGETFGADKDAPSYMLEALDEFLQETGRTGYTFWRIDENLRQDKRKEDNRLSWEKKLLIAVWMAWEKLFHGLFHVRPVDSGNKLIYLRVCRYHGQSIHLGDGEEMRSGDRVVELHFNNAMLLHMVSRASSAVQLSVRMIRAVEQLLPKIAERIVNDPEFARVKGVYGISILHRGAKQFGFTVTDLSKGLFFTVTRLYLRLLLRVIHPHGKRRLQSRAEVLTPKLIAISASELRRRYPVKIGSPFDRCEMGLADFSNQVYLSERQKVGKF